MYFKNMHVERAHNAGHKERRRGMRPQRRTDLIALELDRFKIDLAALQETRRSGEGSLIEVGRCYTIFWRIYPENQLQQHAGGLAIRTKLIDRITEAPSHVSERFMTLLVPLVEEEHAAILCCYAPQAKISSMV